MAPAGFRRGRHPEAKKREIRGRIRANSAGSEVDEEGRTRERKDEDEKKDEPGQTNLKNSAGLQLRAPAPDPGE